MIDWFVCPLPDSMLEMVCFCLRTEAAHVYLFFFSFTFHPFPTSLIPCLFEILIFQHHVADYFAAKQRCPWLQGRCTAHSGRQTLQVPTATTAFQTDGLRICPVADALLVHVTTEGLPQLPLQETNQGPVGQGRSCFPGPPQHLAVWWVTGSITIFWSRLDDTTRLFNSASFLFPVWMFSNKNWCIVVYLKWSFCYQLNPDVVSVQQ